MARFWVTYKDATTVNKVLYAGGLDRQSYLTLALFHVNLVAEHDEREVLRVVWACLDEELVTPAIERLKGLGAVHIVDEHAAVRPTVESHPKRLEPFLTRRVP